MVIALVGVLFYFIKSDPKKRLLNSLLAGGATLLCLSGFLYNAIKASRTPPPPQVPLSEMILRSRGMEAQVAFRMSLRPDLRPPLTDQQFIWHFVATIRFIDHDHSNAVYTDYFRSLFHEKPHWENIFARAGVVVTANQSREFRAIIDGTPAPT